MLSIALALALASPPVMTNVIGEAPLDADQLLSVTHAKNDARRRALEQGVGLSIESSTVVRNFTLVSDIVSSRAKGVLMNERFGEPAFEGNVVKVSLSARVSKDLAAEAACSVLRSIKNPRVAVVLGDKDGRGMTEIKLTQELISGCMTVVESPLAPPKDMLEASFLAALASKAEFAILGGTKDARVVDLTTSEVIAVVPMEDRNAAVDALFKKLATTWTDQAVNGREVTVTVPVRNFALATKVAAFIGEAAGSPTNKDLRDGVMILRVHASGDALDLAALLEGKVVDGMVINIVEARGGSLSLELKPQSGATKAAPAADGAKRKRSP